MRDPPLKPEVLEDLLNVLPEPDFAIVKICETSQSEIFRYANKLAEEVLPGVRVEVPNCLDVRFNKPSKDKLLAMYKKFYKEPDDNKTVNEVIVESQAKVLAELRKISWQATVVYPSIYGKDDDIFVDIVHGSQTKPSYLNNLLEVCSKQGIQYRVVGC
jgi:hypothetical protein